MELAYFWGALKTIHIPFFTCRAEDMAICCREGSPERTLCWARFVDF